MTSDSFLGLFQWEGGAHMRPDFNAAWFDGRAAYRWHSDSPRSRLQAGALGSWQVLVWGSLRSPAFKTGSAVEALLGCLAAGQTLADFLADCSGEFAICAWDDHNRAAYLAVDPIGLYKLYYRQTAQAVVVSSHPQQIGRITSDFEIDPDGLFLYLSLRGIPAPYSLLKRIHKVIPGSVLQIDRQGRKETQVFYYRPPGYSQPPQSFEDSCQSLTALLTDSVGQCLADSQPRAGIFLSGGIDSAYLAALAKKQAGLTAFSVGYLPAYRKDETGAAQATARLLDLPVQTFKPAPSELLDILEAAAPDLPEPVADASFLSQLYLARQAGPQTNVLLDGTGADNLFGGLNKVIAESYLRLLSRLPGFSRRMLSAVLERMPTSRKWALTDQARKLQKLLYGYGLTGQQRQVYWTRFIHPEILHNLVQPAWLPDRDLAQELLIANYDTGQFDSDLQASAAMSMKTIMPWGSLYKLYCIDLLSGVSIRAPFLSPAMIHFGFNLPDEYKVHGREVKYILRQAARQVVPRPVLDRAKGNFSPPVGEWLRGDFNPLLRELIQQDSIFDRSYLASMLREQFEYRRDWSLELWTVFILLQWIKSQGTLK